MTVAAVSAAASVMFAIGFTRVNPLLWPVVSVCRGLLERERGRNYAHQPDQLRPGTVLLNRAHVSEHPHGLIWTSSPVSPRETRMNPNQLA